MTPAAANISRKRTRSRRNDSSSSSSDEPETRLGDEARASKASRESQDSALVPVVEQQHLVLTLQPSRDYPVPWGRQWPQLIEFYVNNPSAFEFTGTNLYKKTGEITPLNDQYNFFRSSPGTLTLRILFAESARPGLRTNAAQRYWLKSQALMLVNRALSDPASQLSGSTLSDVLTFHNYERVFGSDMTAIRAHRSGVRRMIDLMGGIRNVGGDAEKLVPMILWGDRARQAARAYDPTESPPEYPLDLQSGLQPLHPLNLALLPPDKLRTIRERTLAIGTSILGPGVRLMVALDALKKLSRFVASISPNNDASIRIARYELSVIEQGLLLMTPENSDIYTNPKYAIQQLIIEAAKLNGLVMVHHLTSLFEPTRLTCARKDHVLMRAALLRVEPLLQSYPKVLLWTLFLQAPLQHVNTRAGFFELANATLDKLQLTSWAQIKPVLESFDYYPEIQDKLAYEFWMEAHKFKTKTIQLRIKEEEDKIS